MYVDANVFAFAILSTDAQGKRAQAFLDSLEHGKRAMTSVLVIDELMWVLMKHGQKKLVPEIVEELYSIRNLEIKEVPADIPLRALAHLEKLKPRDAFHAATMEHFGVKEIVSDDKDFDKVSGIKRIAV